MHHTCTGMEGRVIHSLRVPISFGMIFLLLCRYRLIRGWCRRDALDFYFLQDGVVELKGCFVLFKVHFSLDGFCFLISSHLLCDSMSLFLFIRHGILAGRVILRPDLNVSGGR